MPPQRPDRKSEPSGPTLPGSVAASSAAAAAAVPASAMGGQFAVELTRLLPAWTVSVLVHAAVLTTLGVATVSSQGPSKQVVNIDSALSVRDSGQEAEDLKVYADPANLPRDQAVGDEHAMSPGELPPEGTDDTGADSEVVAVSQGVVSNRPNFRGTNRSGAKIAAEVGVAGEAGIAFDRSPLRTNPIAPSFDIGGGGKIAGDPGFGVKDVGAALDQIAREILRHLRLHKLTIVWMFDESTSMKDDQRAILEKFDRVSTELKLGVEVIKGKKVEAPLLHAVVGFGEGVDLVLEKPTPDIDRIGRAIKGLRVDPSGIENTMMAIKSVADHYAGLINKDRKLLIVLVTDESGDDGSGIEEARQALKSRNIPLFVIGRQAIFGYPYAHHVFQDKTTGDNYYPVIRRGPESADVELFQWDGLYSRTDEQPSGFAPYELARLTRDTGGLYFLLPTEEFMRAHQREKLYSRAQLKEYEPEYDNRLTYAAKREQSVLRRNLQAIIAESKTLLYRRNFPIDPQAQAQAASEEGEKAMGRLNTLLAIQTRLEQLAKAADREPERRWRAHYQLMLASTVAFEVKAYEYRALMASIVNFPRMPAKPAAPGTEILWVVDHSPTPVAPKSDTAKKSSEAERLLKKVIADHPNTPWADLAADILKRGFSVQLNEWHRNPKYDERAQYVPKY